MFTAGNGAGSSLLEGFGGVYPEDAAHIPAASRHKLDLSDGFRCALLLGPACALLGGVLLVLASADPQRASLKSYNAAVSAWGAPGGGLAQFQAAVGSQPALVLSPPLGLAQGVTLTLLPTTTPPPGLLNSSSQRVATAPALAYFDSAPHFYSGWSGYSGWTGGAMLASMVGLPGFPEPAPLLLLSCSNTQGLQYGVNCSADSPPAPAPTAATELFVMERRHRRALMQSDSALAAESASGGGGGLFSLFGTAAAPSPAVTAAVTPPRSTQRATSCRGYYRTLTLLTSVTLVANPPTVPDTAAGYANPNWTLTVAPCHSVRTSVNMPVSLAQWKADVKGGSVGISPAWCGAWPTVFSAPALYAAGAGGIAVTLRSASDPLLAADSLTKCSGALGVAPGSYFLRGSLFLVGGVLTSLAGFVGMRRIARAEGHELGVAAPLASLQAAWQSYGATQGAQAAVIGTPAQFSATVGTGARRRAPGGLAPGGLAPGRVPGAPPGAQRFDGVTAEAS